MKHLIFLVLALPLFLSAQDDQIIVGAISWHLNYDTALAEAKKQDKNVLVYFTGSDWCAPCKMLKKDLFETEDFRNEASDYVLLYIDIPRNRDLLSAEQMEHNKTLLPKLNKKNVFPLFTVLDKKEKEIDQISGYNMNGEIRYHLDFIQRNKG